MAERESRRDRLAATMAAHGLDALLVTHLPNIRYLTGFTGTSGALLMVGEEAVFLTDFRYEVQAHAEVGQHARIEIVGADMWGRAWALLAQYPGVASLGFESHATTVADAERIRAAGSGGARLTPMDGLVERLRETKEPREVERIAAAAALATEALGAVTGEIRPGQRELDVAARLEFELRQRGSEWQPFTTIVASGPRSALPHARTSTRVIERGDLLLCDFGATVDGYCSDITRTFVVGAPPTQQQKAVYDAVLEAQRRALAGLRSGMSGADGDRIARWFLEARGYGAAFGHSLGHGLGLEVHEAPRVARTNQELLAENTVVTVEPGVYLPGWGGVRLEDDVVLTPEGARLLSDGAGELVVL